VFFHALFGLFAEYVTYFIFILIQLVFILLKVTFKNWSDDFLNVLTYLSFQLFFACVLFIGIPPFLNVPLISHYMQYTILGSVALLSLLRVFYVIPLDFSKLFIEKVNSLSKIDFGSFFSIERLRQLQSIDFQQPDADMRYNKIKERLLRVRPDSNSVSEE
jgi:hypothetical protein